MPRKKIKRIYHCSDKLLLTHAQSIKGHVEKNVSAFAARYPFVNAAYLVSFQQKIDDARACLPDYSVKKNIAVIVSEVYAEMAHAQVALDKLFIYAAIAWYEDKKQQRVFGQDKMRVSRKYPLKMISLLEHAHNMASKVAYKNALMAAGCTQTQIDDLKTTADAIRKKIKTKKSAKKDRQVYTAGRIALYNLVFENIVETNTCARILYRFNKAQQKKFRIYPLRRKKKNHLAGENNFIEN